MCTVDRYRGCKAAENYSLQSLPKIPVQQGIRYERR